MRFLRFSPRWIMPWLVFCVALVLSAQQAAPPPLVRSWTIREIGAFKKIPTATLQARMAQRGVLFGVDEPYDRRKVDGTTLLLRQLYKDEGVLVSVHAATIPQGPHAVKIEYVVNKR